MTRLWGILPAFTIIYLQSYFYRNYKSEEYLIKGELQKHLARLIAKPVNHLIKAAVQGSTMKGVSTMGNYFATRNGHGTNIMRFLKALKQESLILYTYILLLIAVLLL